METAAEQRERIIRDNWPRVLPNVYDDLVSLGYEPESWTGMWKIAPVEHPVLWVTRRWALVKEVVYQPGTVRAVTTRRNTQKTRWVLKREGAR